LCPSGRLNSASRGKSCTVNDAVCHIYFLDRVRILVAIAAPRSSLNDSKLLITYPASYACAVRL